MLDDPIAISLGYAFDWKPTKFGKIALAVGAIGSGMVCAGSFDHTFRYIYSNDFLNFLRDTRCYQTVSTTKIGDDIVAGKLQSGDDRLDDDVDVAMLDRLAHHRHAHLAKSTIHIQ